MENIDRGSLKLIESYLNGGGTILSSENPIPCVNGVPDASVTRLRQKHPLNWNESNSFDLTDEIRRLAPSDLVFEKGKNTGGLLFHMRRNLKDATILFLANASEREPAEGRFSLPGGSAENWDPFTGSIVSYPFEKNGGKLGINFALPPGGSLLLCIRPEPGKHSQLRKAESFQEKIATDSQLVIKAEQPNVLTLDYCDLALQGKVEKDLYFYDAQQKIFQAHGLPNNPWDSSVQFKTAILDRNHFTPDSGFEAMFRFSASDGVNVQSLRAVVERPELYRVFVNDLELRPLADHWWLDRAFGLFDIGLLVRPGENTIRLKSRPFTIHSELEPVYLLGDFCLKAEVKGFSLIPSQALTLGPWNRQGFPFYGTGVQYGKSFALPEGANRTGRYVVRLGDWRGAVASVLVNGRSAGFIAFQPYELDITDRLTAGPQTVTVTVYGTLKNTLGPHHNKPPLGVAWPASFQKGAEGGYPAGTLYDTVGYGLYEDFVVERMDVR
jgi:hypothetical protein